MLVLLPPSEGKTAPVDGAPLDLGALSGGRRLTAHRRRVLTALVRASRRPDALDVLGAGASLAPEVARNTRLRAEPTAPARHVYTGVLFGAARLDDLPDDDARSRSDRTVRVVSALWGVVTPSDPIPAYRLSMGTDLSGVGPLARSWREPLARELDPVARDRLVVDCRSAAYAAAWTPSGGPGHVGVTVLREEAGRRTVVSHWAKHTRGVLTRHLVTRAGAEPGTPQQLLDAAGELVGTALLDADLRPGRRTGTHELQLVVG
ncbi:peroxide stress protein YaaA [Actinotalea ferrariae]|uniref:YaaA family protein n=1 Tax=Actinotalea ferrariae TaxID=1386098 RepID=UPI001C8B2584|nr:peroxide stress protein YaaA [Actinotalea ferrariae]MBX9243431.1 peroxide stress protein YaaA [Actinotalea ferrariae]